MPPISLWLGASALVLAFLTGSGSGYLVRDTLAHHEIDVCAEGFRLNNIAKCPSAIVNAYTAQVAKVQIEYRDRTIPLIVHDKSEAIAAAARLQADIQQLEATKDDAKVCANSPAFVALRMQLASPDNRSDPASR